ncbi:MAG: hypothetical protein IKE77_04490 [Erysipelotrichaceae bacterium]|nr:hypothetical protein [Erysipelotrichaceae bacterium]
MIWTARINELLDRLGVDIEGRFTMENDVTYYVIRDSLLGKHDKREDDGYYLYINGEWQRDINHIILGYLFGFDPSEEDDSPYAMGNDDIMDQIEELTAEQAQETMNHDEIIASDTSMLKTPLCDLWLEDNKGNIIPFDIIKSKMVIMMSISMKQMNWLK